MYSLDVFRKKIQLILKISFFACPSSKCLTLNLIFLSKISLEKLKYTNLNGLCKSQYYVLEYFHKCFFFLLGKVIPSVVNL
jgi:hypothetical protein